MFHYLHANADHTACELPSNTYGINLTNVPRLVTCEPCREAYAHLAANDSNRGRDTACGTTSNNLRSSRSLSLVTCPECLVSERFRKLSGLQPSAKLARIGRDGDQS